MTTALPIIEAADSPAEERPALIGLDRASLRELVTSLGQPAYRADQLARWIYQRGAADFEQMTDLPAGLRSQLTQTARVRPGEVVGRAESRDGTVKLLLEFEDGRQVETVMLPYRDRTSVCVSSQVGCPVGCTFCATATMGFTRNLTAAEMLTQTLEAEDIAPPRQGDRRVTHVVVMGMGEPLLNVREVTRFIHLLREELGISPRRVTISTAGYVPGIRALAEANLPVTLAISLHAPEDALREQLIPLNHRFPLAEVMGAARAYFQATGRRVTMEYLLLGGVNDGPEHAKGLAKLVNQAAGHVNLIPWNPADTLSPFRAPERGRVQAFRRALEEEGVVVTQRQERGQDIDAACGQLAVRSHAGNAAAGA